MNENSTIKMSAPVKVFNFKSEDNPTQTIIGLYLTTLFVKDPDDLLVKLKNKSEMEGINDKSLLLFDRRHVYEVCGIINGILEYFESAVWISDRSMISELFNLTSKCMTYAEFKSSIMAIVSRFKPVLPYPVYESFRIVMQYIWFIPYSGMNELYTEATEAYNKGKESLKNEESNN